MTTAITRARHDRLAPSTQEIQVIVSDRAEDADLALSVVHDGFVEAGFMSPQASGRRLHPAYLNPGTTFVVAMLDGEPIGAGALVPDGPFGLPCERAFAEEVDALRAASSARLIECGSFVVLSEWRRHTRRATLRVLAAFMRVAMAEHPDSPGLLTSTPEAQRFHSSVSGFRPISAQRALFGAPAVLMLADNVYALGGGDGAADTAGRRALDRLAYDSTASWLTDRREGTGLSAEWLEPLAREQLASTRLGVQLRSLYHRYPGLLQMLATGPAER